MPRDMPELSAKRGRRLQSSSTSSKDSRYCDVCNKEFSRPSELKRHLANTLVHNPSARKYQCQYCGSLHTQKSNLRIHERIHLNELKEVCNLPFNETHSALCDFKCSDPSSMTRHIHKMHASPFYDSDRDQVILPPWLARAMENRAESKGSPAEHAWLSTTPLSSSPRSTSPRSSAESNLCTPSPLSEESPASPFKSSHFQNNFTPRTVDGIDSACLPPDFPTLPSVQEPFPHVSDIPDLTFDSHQLLTSLAHIEDSLAPAPTLSQLTTGSFHLYSQDGNPDFSVPYAAQDADFFDLSKVESFNPFSTNYLV